MNTIEWSFSRKDCVHFTQQVHTMSSQGTHSKSTCRKYASAFKRELVERCMRPSASVSGIGLENGIHANVLFRWRREYLRAPHARRVMAFRRPFWCRRTLQLR